MGARKGTSPCYSSARGASLHIHHSGSAQPASIPPLQQAWGCNAPGAPFWGYPFISSSYQARGATWCVPTPNTTAEHANKTLHGQPFLDTHIQPWLYTVCELAEKPSRLLPLPCLHGIEDQLPIDPTSCQQSPREILQLLPAGPGTMSTEAEPTQTLEEPPAPK